MSAEPRRVTKPEVWAQWESHVVNGIFPLRRFLGGSNHSAVFLTEYKAQKVADVAIKFVPAETLQTQAQQLVQWGAAATLSHPHLLRIFDVGRCQVGGRDFLFLVMEYAEQTLAQILPQRALTCDEVREMLLPTLDALAFLHRNQMVHGELKPSNFLVVNDQLKLASDTVRAAGNSMSGIVTSLYDPPELRDGVISTAGDVWALGITLVEALTQRTPAWSDERPETAALPAGFPAPFVDTVRRCLNRTPANRPTVIELEAQYKPAPPQAHVAPLPQPPAREASRQATTQQNPPKRHVLLPTIATVLLISLAAWVGLRFFPTHSNSPQSTSDAAQAQLQLPADPAAADPAATAPAAPAPAAPARAALVPAAPAPAAPAPAAPSPTAKTAAPSSGLSTPISRQPDQLSLPPAATSPSVLHEVSPDVPQAIRAKIQGHINVTVRVLVDPSGDVVGEFLEHPGPSRYFARVAGDAAGEWKFAPADTKGPRVWLLHFEFDRNGVTADATAAQ
jgi:serine/threonine-protein kinase